MSYTETLTDGSTRLTEAGRRHALAVAGLPADTPNQTSQIMAKVRRLQEEARTR